MKLKVGMKVECDRYGEGEVISKEGNVYRVLFMDAPRILFYKKDGNISGTFGDISYTLREVKE